MRRASNSFRWTQLVIGIDLHGDDRQSAIRLDVLRSRYSEDVPLGTRGDPNRLHPVRPVRDLAGPDRGLVRRQVGPEARHSRRRHTFRHRLDHELLRHDAGRPDRLLRRADHRRHWRGRRLWHLHRQRAQVVPRQARPRRRSDGSGLRCGIGADGRAHPEHDRGQADLRLRVLRRARLSVRRRPRGSRTRSSGSASGRA